MRITVKVLKMGKVFDVEVEPQDSGKSLVHKVATELAVAPEIVRIIANMTVLKEALSLEENKIADGTTVQVSLKTAQPIQVKETVLPEVKAGSNVAENPQQPQQNATGAGGFDMMGMMRNPEMMKQMMQNPMIQSIYDNPELMKQMLQSNPLIQKMIEQHPELEDAFSDPAALQMMQDMRDPAKMDEILRQQDQAIANLQNVPGGMEMLQKYQQDLSSLMEEQMGNKETSTTGGDWFLPEQKPKQAEKVTKVEPTAEDDDFPLPKSYLQLIKVAAASTSTPAKPTPQQPLQMGGFGMPQMGGMPAMGGMPGMNDPKMLQEMMNNPAVDQIMDQLTNDPVAFQAYMNNPMVKAQLQQMTGNNPMLEQMFQNPEILRQQFKMAREMMRQGQGIPGMPGMPDQFPGAQMPTAQRPAGPTQSEAAKRSAQTMQALQVLKGKWGGELATIQSLGITADEATILQLLEMYNGNVEMVVNQLFENQ